MAPATLRSRALAAMVSRIPDSTHLKGVLRIRMIADRLTWGIYSHAEVPRAVEWLALEARVIQSDFSTHA